MKRIPSIMESFETELAGATNPANGVLLGAVAMVIDNKGERSLARPKIDKSLQLTARLIKRQFPIPSFIWTPVSRK